MREYGVLLLVEGKLCNREFRRIGSTAQRLNSYATVPGYFIMLTAEMKTNINGLVRNRCHCRTKMRGR